MKNRIFYIGTAHPFRGGLAGFNERLAKEFTEDGNDVTLYNFSLQYPNFLFPGATQYTKEPAPKGIKILQKINSINPFNWIKIGLEIKKQKPDFIIIKYWLPFMAPCFGTILRIAKRNKHSKVICIIDNIVPHEARFLDRWLTKYFVKPVDGFISMSKEVMQQLEYFDKTKPRKLSPHPIFDHFGDLINKKEALEKLNLDPKYQYYLFFGFIRDYKGLDLLLEAFAKTKNELKNVKLLIAGEFYSNRQKYEQLIQKHALANDIELHTHFIQDSEVKYYFSACDLLALPYKSATQSGVTQIGFHFETPMLVTNVGGLPELIENNRNGLVVEADIDSVAKGLLDFFHHENKIQLKNEVISDKNKYTWKNLENAIFEIYQKTHKN